ncbi:MAG: YceI family protein [Cyclobacteriaceae bacterium]
MKNLKQLILICAIGLLPAGVYAQYALQANSSKLSIDGTSTLHDWTITAEGMNGSASLDMGSGLEGISNLEFAVIVDELNSGKGAMDKNTYEALKESKYPNISYELTKVNSINDMGGNKYKLSTTGNLSIAGTKKAINMDVTATVSGSTVKFEGSYPMKMTDFNIEPPTAMFGTIKTGDEITIKYTVNYSK